MGMGEWPSIRDRWIWSDDFFEVAFDPGAEPVFYWKRDGVTVRSNVPDVAFTVQRGGYDHEMAKTTNIDVHVHFGPEWIERLDRIEAKLDRVLAMVAGLIGMEMEQMDDFTELEAQVTGIEDGVEAAGELISQLAADFREHADDPEQIRQLADRLEQAKERLGSAVVAGTPAAAPEEQAPAPDDPGTPVEGTTETTDGTPGDATSAETGETTPAGEPLPPVETDDTV